MTPYYVDESVQKPDDRDRLKVAVEIATTTGVSVEAAIRSLVLAENMYAKLRDELDRLRVENRRLAADRKNLTIMFNDEGRWRNAAHREVERLSAELNEALAELKWRRP